MVTLTLKDEHSGERLDKIVASELGLSRATARRLFEERRVRLGRRALTKSELLPAGSILEIEPLEAPKGPLAPNPDLPLKVALETPQVLVLDKQARLPTAPLRLDETHTLLNAVLARFPEILGVGSNPLEPGLVHRLDNDTSGLVMVARDQASFTELFEAVRAGAVKKEYLAICHDGGLGGRATLELPIAPHPRDPRKVLVCVHPRDIARYHPRPAHTELEVLRRWPGYALVRLHASKAVRHQLRAHLAGVDCPILGDTLYGAPVTPGLDRHALHASAISWAGGAHVSALQAESPLPEELARWIPSSEV